MEVGPRLDEGCEVRMTKPTHTYEVCPLHKRLPTCDTLDELLQKIQTFVQEHHNVEVLCADDPHNVFLGMRAYSINKGLETGIYETTPLRDTLMSPELRVRIRSMFSTAGGRIKLAKNLMRGVKFV